MSHKNIINIPTKNPPVVELDSDSCAAYVRFSNKSVAKTEVLTEDKVTVTIDINANGDVVGVELVGVKEFNVNHLLKVAGRTAPRRMLENARYIPAKLQVA